MMPALDLLSCEQPRVPALRSCSGENSGTAVMSVGGGYKSLRLGLSQALASRYSLSFSPPITSPVVHSSRHVLQPGAQCRELRCADGISGQHAAAAVVSCAEAVASSLSTSSVISSGWHQDSASSMGAGVSLPEARRSLTQESQSTIPYIAADLATATSQQKHRQAADSPAAASAHADRCLCSHCALSRCRCPQSSDATVCARATAGIASWQTGASMWPASSSLSSSAPLSYCPPSHTT